MTPQCAMDSLSISLLRLLRNRNTTSLPTSITRGTRMSMQRSNSTPIGIRSSPLLGRRKSLVVVYVAAISTLLLVSCYFLAPHWICTMTNENQHFLREQCATSTAVRIVKLYPEAAIRLIRMAASDTVIVHLWNSSQPEGTRLFLPLQRFSRLHPKTRVIHVCTDLNGIRQRRYAARLAEWYTKQNLQYIVASRPSLFDLDNVQGTRSFLHALNVRHDSTSLPLALVFDRQARILFQTTVINS